MYSALVFQPRRTNVDWLSPLAKAGWRIHPAHSLTEAKKIIGQEQVHIGLTVCEAANGAAARDKSYELARVHPSLPWISIIHPQCFDIAAVREQIVNSCVDYHTIPIDPNRLLVTMGHAVGLARLRRLTFDAAAKPMLPGEHGILGESPEICEVLAKLNKVARAEVPVLLLGENGTGKELVARAIHEHSRRSSGPFVAINCAALPATLIQSALFGHEKGAFTGAFARKIGRFEAASGGTLFLDEIADLSAELQVNLLRFLQEHVIERLGGRDSIPVDVRVVAATNIDLKEALADGRFREDLYFRLNVVTLQLPPLRERGADAEQIAVHSLREFVREQGLADKILSDSAINAINRHDWPGNVRELLNRVRRAAVMGDQREISAEDMELPIGKARPSRFLTLDEEKDIAEAKAIRKALARHAGSISDCAKELGVSRATLYRLLKKHRLPGTAST